VRAGAVRSTRAASLARPRHWRNGGHDTCNAREGQHDDVVLAVAIGAWLAERGTTTVQFF